MSGLIDAHPLSTEESLRRLASVRFGRFIYTRHAPLTVVNHLLEGATILAHAHTTALTITDHLQAAAYEVDSIDHHTHTGWYVTARGLAEEITDPALRDRGPSVPRRAGRRPCRLRSRAGSGADET